MKNCLDKRTHNTSLGALQTFLIGIDFMTSHYDSISSMEFNIVGSGTDVYPTEVGWDGGINLHLKKSMNKLIADFPNTTNNNYTQNNDVAKGWAWATTNVPFAHSVATGKGVKVAVIDGAVFKIQHNDTLDKSGKSSRFEEDIHYNNFNDCLSFNCGSDKRTIAYNHGHACVMTGYGSEDISSATDYIGNSLYRYGTVGVAPETTVIPYHESFPLGWAYAIARADLKGAQVISLSMSIPFAGLLKYWKSPEPVSSIVINLLRPQSLYDAIFNSALVNVPVVVSAGNDSRDRYTNVPSDSDDALVVGAVSPLRNELLKTDEKDGLSLVDLGQVDVGQNYQSVDQIETYNSTGTLDPIQPPYSNTTPNSCPTPTPIPGVSPTPTPYTVNHFNSTQTPGCSEEFGFSAANFSNYGNDYGEDIFWAPGKYIFISDPNSTGPYVHIYNQFDGTSAAAPFLAGCIALLKQLEPGITTNQIKQVLKDSAVEKVRASREMRAARYPEYDSSRKMISVENALVSVLKKQNIILPVNPADIDGKVFKNIISNLLNTIGKGTQSLITNYGSTLVIAAFGDLSNATVTIDGQNIPIIATTDAGVSVQIPDTLTPGTKDVTLQSNFGRLVYQNAINIVHDTTSNSQNKVIFTRKESDDKTYIYSMFDDGSYQTKLLEGNYPSSNTKKIGYNYNGKLSIMGLDGTNNNLTSIDTRYGGAWSPNKVDFAYNPDANTISKATFESFYVMSRPINPYYINQLYYNSSENVGQPIWSTDGDKLMFTSYNPNIDSYDSYVISQDGSSLIKDDVTDGWLFTKDWSTHNTILADKLSSTDALYSYNSDFSNPVKMVDCETYCGDAYWGYATGDVIYSDQKSNGQYIIRKKSQYGSYRDIYTLPIGKSLYSFKYYSDKQKIYFVSDLDGTSGNLNSQEIYSINEDGTGLLRLTNNNYQDNLPTFVPYIPDGIITVALANRTHNTLDFVNYKKRRKHH